jgi:hypothetical protein
MSNASVNPKVSCCRAPASGEIQVFVRFRFTLSSRGRSVPNLLLSFHSWFNQSRNDGCADLSKSLAYVFLRCPKTFANASSLVVFKRNLRLQCHRMLSNDYEFVRPKQDFSSLFCHQAQ